ncbi:MAG: glycosyltransferase family 2 protein [Shimia sp.]
MTWSKIVVCTMKNEGPYLLEWIAYHRSIGFDGFVICSNDCTDGTNLMLNRLDALGVVRHFDNPQGPNMDPQRSAYRIANDSREMKKADWALVIDADEFLNVHAGDRSVDALIAASGTPDAISLNWRLMGSSGETEANDELVTARFTRGSTHDEPENGLVWGFKTLFRPAVFDYLGVHRPRWKKWKFDDLTAESARWVNGSGQDMGTKYFEKGWRSGSESYGYANAQVNHYAIKSKEEFLFKRLRGTANSKDKARIDFEYWDKYDINSQADATIPTEGTRIHMARLLTDPTLAALHHAARDHMARTIAAQKEDEAVQEFLSGARPEAA